MSMSHRDSNRELVMDLANIHYRQSDPEGILKGLSFADPEYVCKECARMVTNGSIEQAVQFVRQRRAESPSGNKGVVNIPSHLVALDGYRQEAADRKVVLSEDLANDEVARLSAENDDLKTALSKAMIDLATLKEAPLQRLETVSVDDLKKVVLAASDEVLIELPYVGEGNLSAVRAWAETDEG